MEDKSDIRSFFVSTERSSPGMNGTLRWRLVVNRNFQLEFMLLVFYITIIFIFVFFGGITLCIICDIVKWAHIVYVTLFGGFCD